MSHPVSFGGHTPMALNRAQTPCLESLVVGTGKGQGGYGEMNILGALGGLEKISHSADVHTEPSQL